MDFHGVGQRIRTRRDALGLSQKRLAKLAGLSRATINQLEMGTISDLGVTRLDAVLNVVGLQLQAQERTHKPHSLLQASRTASVSYRTALRSSELAHALATGELPPRILPQIATLIDEAPLPLLVRAVEEAAEQENVPAKTIWRHIERWAKELQSPRQAWA